MALVGMGIALATQANAVTFTFQENGTGDLGSNTSTFIESGISLTASAFLNNGNPTNLYVKNGPEADEFGLGTAADPTGNHEIFSGDFVQLTVPTSGSPSTTFDLIISGSTTLGESLDAFFTTTPGSISGATPIGSITTDGGSLVVPAFAQGPGFIDITASGPTNANVLLASVSVTPVPETGSVVLLAIGLAMFGMTRAGRTLLARKASK
jgi:hypothetical protein